MCCPYSPSRTTVRHAHHEEGRVQHNVNKSDRDRLVVDNLPLVGYLVAQVCSGATHLSRDDLAQAGAMALVKAANSFDAARGVPFGAYARERILGGIKDEMRGMDWAKRTTRHAITQANATRETLQTALGRAATVDEIAGAMGIDRAAAREALDYADRSVASIDTGIADFLENQDDLPDEQLIVNERLTYLRSALGALPERMRYIITEVYLNDRPIGDIADELGVTHSAVSQQRTEAINLMRSGMGLYDPESIDVAAAEARLSTSRRTSFLDAFTQSLSTNTAVPEARFPINHTGVVTG